MIFFLGTRITNVGQAENKGKTWREHKISVFLQKRIINIFE